MFASGKHGQHGGAITVVGVASASAEDAFAVLPQDLEVAVPICTEQTRWIQRLASAIAPASLGEGPATFYRPAGRTSLSRKSATYNAAWQFQVLAPSAMIEENLDREGVRGQAAKPPSPRRKYMPTKKRNTKKSRSRKAKTSARPTSVASIVAQNLVNMVAVFATSGAVLLGLLLTKHL
jgi:hypothetical protein